MQKRVIVLLVIIVLLGGAVWYSQYRKNQTTVNDQVDSLLQAQQKDDLERASATDEAIMQGQYPTDQEDLVITYNQAAEQDVHQLQQAYDQAAGEGDAARQFRVLQQIYENNEDVTLLPPLVELALTQRMYDTALGYVAILEQQDMLLGTIDQSRIFDLLFNGLDLNFKDIERIKGLLTYYVQQGYVGTGDEALYSALITFARGDMDNYSFYIDALKNSKYAFMSQQFAQDQHIVSTFPDVSSSYLEMLTALHLFHQGRYQVARVGAARAINQDPEYVLPRQIDAYASLLLEEFVDARKSLERLILHDEDHASLYSFLLGIVNFRTESYADAILLLERVEDERYTIDAKRYLLLSYTHIGERAKAGKILEELLQEELTIYDFFSTFELFFYEPLRKGATLDFYAFHSELAERYVHACYEQVDDLYAYICLYGKAGRLLATGQQDIAYRYLERLVQRYPSSYVFEVLGDIAYGNDQFDLAKQRYVQAVGAHQNSSPAQELVEKVRESVVKGN